VYVYYILEHKASYKGLLVIVKMKAAKENVHIATILFYIHSIKYIVRSCVFFNAYIISGPILCGISVASISQLCVFDMLLLSITGVSHNTTGFIHSLALIVQGGPLASLFGVS
jgi:hypothetical protein